MHGITYLQRKHEGIGIRLGLLLLDMQKQKQQPSADIGDNSRSPPLQLSEFRMIECSFASDPVAALQARRVNAPATSNCP
jgi:hypothetical protein